MYKILKQQNNADNVWEFHVENGSIWGTTEVELAVDKIEELEQTTPSQQLHLLSMSFLLLRGQFFLVKENS